MIKNNRIITAVLITALGIITACTNQEVEIHRNVTVTVKTSTILSGFTPYNSAHFDQYSGDDGKASVRLTCLIYNEAGKLTYSQETLLDDFNKDVTFNTLLEPGTYRLIALASNILGPLSSPSYEAFSITGTESLNHLRIQMNNIGNGGYSFSSTWSIMGYASQSFRDAEEVIDVSMKPATSMVYLFWKDIHAHDNDGATSGDIYGEYSATATDYWGSNTYTWTISIEKDGNSTTDVIVKNFSPCLCKYNFTADKGKNTYKGTINGNKLTIAKGQSTGVTDDEGEIALEGGSEDGELITLEDIILEISDGKLTTMNMFGTCVPEADTGWYDLFNPGVVFYKDGDGSAGIDEYRIIYHLNTVMTFSDSGSPQYSTSLSTVENAGRGVSPSDYPNYQNVYSMCNLFPGTFNIFARTFIGNERADYSQQSTTLVAGHQYVFDLDCSSFKLTPYEGVFGTKATTVESSAFNAFKMTPAPSAKIHQKHFMH